MGDAAQPSTSSDPPTPSVPAAGSEWITVHEVDGTPHRVPLRPDGAYLRRLERGAARRDAKRPLEELLDELSAATGALDEIERAFGGRPPR